jgi:hypothetical protein
LELSKKRSRREISDADYAAESKEVIANLNELFAGRDGITAENAGLALQKNKCARVADVLQGMESTDKFDREIFNSLIEGVRINARTDIDFIFKNGMTVKAVIKQR